VTRNSDRYLAICGGVGGAKLALGLSRVLDPSQLTIVVNTGDDFEHLGLLICPDLDTVCYTLAGIVDPQQGWGRKNESWNALAEVEHLGGETWFRLGDKDLGLHLVRRALLDRGMPLSAVTAHIARRLGIAQEILPMSDHPVRTEVETDQGRLAFQHYFVRERCEPRVRSIGFAGSQSAQPAEGFIRALLDSALKGVIICPSNPFLSIDPILSLPGVRELLSDTGVPVIAVSPVVGGRAIKGPTAKIMQELGIPVTVDAVASHYAGLLNGMIIDSCDKDSARMLEESMSIHCCDTIMKNTQDKITLAGQVLDFISSLGGSS
jgi:LPPG:FO 2-phospho-L-lactate transferase